MKFISKLAVLAIAMLFLIEEHTMAHKLRQQNRITTLEDGEGDEPAPEGDAEPAADDKKSEEEPDKKDAKADAKPAEKGKKDAKKGDEKKGGKKDKKKDKDAAEEGEDEDAPQTSLLNPGASAGQSQTVDAMQDGPCEERLNITEYEMIKQMEYFARRLEIDYFNNAMTIWKNLTKEGRMDRPLMVHTWELYDKAFSFPRVRRYAFVQENLDMLEHFEDNLNTNVSNKQNLANFLRVANTVRHNLNEKYGKDGGFNDPALDDPYEIVEETWATVKLPEPVY